MVTMRDHLVIFDTQIKPNSDIRHIDSIGKYIVRHQPEVIIVIGDWFDMHSLSSYDRGTKNAEGARYTEDIKCGVKALQNLFKHIKEHNRYCTKSKKKKYSPELHFTIGNHEERIMRHVNANPLLEGMLSYDNLKLKEFGFKVHNFLAPVIIDGVEYVHFVQNRNTPNPKSSSKVSMDQTKMSVTQGHRPCLDISTSWADDKGMMWSITCGSSYLDDEKYKGSQGNKHWRGIVHKRNVDNGDFDPTFIRLSSLLKDY
tara:strand:- start:847 stop:1617 length:771 start_codon:yes stop_codon:yes gene_type:complete